MARNDGVDRVSARNVNLSRAKIGNAQKHNEREKESYINPDIMLERTAFNIHFKAPIDDYEKMFAKMEEDQVLRITVFELHEIVVRRQPFFSNRRQHGSRCVRKRLRKITFILE